MNLDEAQKQTVTGWISEGLKLADIQKRLITDLGLNLTYMEVRLLVDDLKLTPKDIERPKSAVIATPASTPAAGGPAGAAPDDTLPASPTAPGSGQLAVTVDELAKPGTVVSGRVTFTDGQSAEWYLDQTGRLGLMPKQAGYRPSQQDVAAFQTELQTQLARYGL